LGKHNEEEDVSDMRLATRLDAVNQCREVLSAEHALELGAKAISQGTMALEVIGTKDTDPD